MENPKKVYIAGPMTGIENWNGKAFKDAEFILKEHGYVVLNPARRPVSNPEDLSHGDYLKISLTLIDISDAIFLLPGWTESVGAFREAEYALSRGKETINLNFIMDISCENLS